MKIHANGLAILSGSIPHIPKSKGIASVIDNGIGSYQFVLSNPVDENYTCIFTARETKDEHGVFVNERSMFERSEVDFLVELRDKNDTPVDADVNFAIIGDSHG